MTIGDRTSFGVIRHHASEFAAGPRPRLHTALVRALSTLESRRARQRLRHANDPIEFVWSRPSPFLVLRERLIRQGWHMSPTVTLMFDRRSTHQQTLMLNAAGAPLSPGPIAAPRLIETIEHRLETRVLERPQPISRTVIHQRPRPEATPPVPPARASWVPVPLTPAHRTNSPSARPDMILARPPAPTVGTPGPTHDREAASASKPRVAASPAPPAPPVRIDRLAAEVIRVLDARSIARRERMGRS